MTEIKTFSFNARLTKPIRLAVAADLHGCEYGRIIDTLSKVAPDALLCPGDTLHKASPDDKGLDFLRAAVKCFPVFCSMGNHEVKHGTDIRHNIRATGATLLDNEFTGFGGINIGGLSSGYTVSSVQGRFKKTPPPDIDAMKDFFASNGFKLLLCHHPEYFDSYLKNKSVDLVVSGHAHGGQWRVFGQGIFAPGQGFFPKYTSGLYRGRLLVSRGLSNHTFIPRIFNKPQLIIIEIK